MATNFKFSIGQDVYVILPSADELFRGTIIRREEKIYGNVYLIDYKEGRSRIDEGNIIGRRFAKFDKQGKQVGSEIFLSEKDAVDSEEDCGYNSLEDQYYAADGMPDELVAVAVEVWEINEMGKPINKINID